MNKWITIMAVVIVMAGITFLPPATKILAQKQDVSVENYMKDRQFRITRAMPQQAVACIECHKQENPGLFADWAASGHAQSGITCLDCHLADPADKDVITAHAKVYEQGDSKWASKEYFVPIATAVTPKDCSRCHPDEVEQYSRSKHANTVEIMWKIDNWLNQGMNSDLERKTGCYNCHGTVLKINDEGKLDPGTWPNVGVGRVNLDGSLGSCTSCHTRHRFSIGEARMPEACDQCHLGPDHPQIEIYEESKHGTMYHAYKDEYNWDAAPGMWTPGVDYRSPTCASCHMSGSGQDVLTSHDVTERLAWESQAPISVRPSEFKPFPARTNHEVEREKMKKVCLQCHSPSWTNDHFTSYDKVNEEYNAYYIPVKNKLEELKEKGLVDGTRQFDEMIEVHEYEMWHHEGRRARFGAAMMAPDYAWWHGFYEMKKRHNEFFEMAHELETSGKPAWKNENFPGATGDPTKPEEIFGTQQ
ncbi:MAG: multiheme c-type cytochrome [Desulfobacterales bacterium]